MSEIFYDDHMLGIFGMVANYCYGKGFDKEWVNRFWEGLQEQPDLYEEFIHFFNTHEILGKYKLHGFSVLDTFVWQMEYDSLEHDKGRNGDTCDKDEMILQAFSHMIDLKHNPEQWTKILSEDQRMDWLDY